MSEPRPIAPVTAIAHLGECSREYERMATAYGPVAEAAAIAEAHYKAQKAKFKLAAKAAAQDNGERMSDAEAETRADGDDTIAGLYRDRLVKAALADAHRQKLLQLREQVATGRTKVASEREGDKLHAQGYGGAA